MTRSPLIQFIVVNISILFFFLGDLKIEIFKSTNVTACNQQLHGWKKEPGGDHVTLRFLNLSRKNELFMSPANEVGDNASEV